MLLVKKCQFSIICFLLKLRLETRFNNVLDRKQLFLTIQKKFQSLKNRIFTKGLIHGFGQKCQFFLFFVFA